MNSPERSNPIRPRGAPRPRYVRDARDARGVRTVRRALALACTAGPLAAGCGFLEKAPTAFDLSAASREAFAASPNRPAELRAELERVFGTPIAPAYLVVDAWRAEDFDPNRPAVARGRGGSGELSLAQLDELARGNERRFARELEHVSRAAWDRIGPWRRAPGLSKAWAALLERRTELDDFAERARDTFVYYYPSLEDSAALYRRECMGCHGNEGGGDGSKSFFLRPAPRDFRLGVFKFTSVADGARPRRADLFRAIADGIEETAMQSFRKYTDAEIHGLVDFVRLLAIRGETERELVFEYEDEEGPVDEDTATAAYLRVFERWRDLDDRVVEVAGEIPAPTPESIARGKRLFEDESKGNCASCHGVDGSGDGHAAFEAAQDDPDELVPAWLDAWGDPIVPRDLRRGRFLYGSEPIDIYRRIYAGINGTPMPAVGDMRDAEGNPVLSDADLWALVHYVRSLADLEWNGPTSNR